MRTIYNIILFLILPFLPFRLWWRSRKNPEYRKNILERFACFNFPALSSSIWIHAASVGESLAAVPLITALVANYPNLKVVVTTMTPTGRERIQKIFNQQVVLLYVPYDYSWIIKRFLRQTSPKILVLMETELWPNIIYNVARAKVPIMLGNARLSLKSFSGYKKFGKFSQKILELLTVVMAQSSIDADRFLALGVDAKKIVTVGNLKFDLKIPDKLWEDAAKLRQLLGVARPIWVAASTHKLEEEKVIVAAKEVLKDLPNALLILVPRHPERFNEVFALGQKEGMQIVRYSEIQNYAVTTNIILGDTMGQLLLFYAASDLAFVGGSLVPWGGHNLLEPAALSKPVLSGPNLSAFVAVSQMLLAHQALIIVDNELLLAKQLIKLFHDQILCKQLGEAALAVVAAQRGATEKTLAMLDRLIGQ